LVKTSLLVGIGSLVAFFIISLYLAKWALRPAAKAWEQQKQFVADASHELRTPLTVILANAGIVLSHPEQTVHNQAKWIEYIQIEAKRMSTLIDNLLFLAKTDDAKSKINLSRVNLSDIVWGSILPFEPVIFEQNKTLVSQISPDCYIEGDESKLKELMGILLDNACKYEDENGTISVNLSEKKSEHKVLLSVSNTGAYIPQDQVNQIFERFFRVDKSRAREQGGYGLGLAIAQSIVRMHNAKISVQSTAESGTTFTVVFPSNDLG
jgi:two-component system, OmpR family, sensor histidine kinase CiaH